MKKYIPHFCIGLIAVCAMSFVISCKEGSVVSPPPPLAMFGQTNDAITIISVGPVRAYPIPLSLTHSTNKDVTLTVAVTSSTGAQNGQQYTLSQNSVTIKAGATTPTSKLVLKVNTSQYANGRVDTLLLSFNPANTNINVFPQSRSLKLLVKLSPCPFNINTYSGTFVVTQDPWADYGVGYKMPVTKVNDSTLSFPSAYSPANYPNATLLLNVNLNTLEITANNPNFADYGTGGNSSAYTSGGISKNYISPCDSTIYLNLNYNVPNYGLVTNQVLIMKKK